MPYRGHGESGAPVHARPHNPLFGWELGIIDFHLPCHNKNNAPYSYALENFHRDSKV